MHKITIPVVDDLTDLTDQQLSEIMKLEKLLLGMFKATKEIAMQRLAEGGKVSGWELGPGKRSRAWKSEAEAIEVLASLGVNDPYEHVLLSPAKAEKKVPEDLKEKLAEGYQWTAGKPSLRQTVAGKASGGFDMSVFDAVVEDSTSSLPDW